jgi:hypothetical protein
VLLLVVTVSSSSLALTNEGSGRTSQYMRKSSASIDLPYTDPLVTAPSGENAPLQVWIDYLLTHSFFIGHVLYNYEHVDVAACQASGGQLNHQVPSFTVQMNHIAICLMVPLGSCRIHANSVEFHDQTLMQSLHFSSTRSWLPLVHD